MQQQRGKQKLWGATLWKTPRPENAGLFKMPYI